MDEISRTLLDRLEAGAASCGCGGYLAKLDPLHRLDLFTRLEYDRLQRKYLRLKQIYDESHQDWYQTFYRLLFRTLGDSTNQSAFEELAVRVPYAIVQRERTSLQRVEAMLLGTSGLLARYPEDEYTRTLAAEFTYLSHKYGLRPMEAGAWRLYRIQPANHPLLRLSQLAVFMTSHELLFDALLECRSGSDVQQLFGVEASPYWQSHYLPANACDRTSVKRIGRQKADLLGINLVSLMQFVYGSFVGREELRERAVALLESIPPESNTFIRRWESWGVRPQNAFDTQALLQLAREYCALRRCAECPVGRRRIAADEKSRQRC